MDRWKIDQLTFMEQGGNARAKQFYVKNGMIKDGVPNHQDPKLAKYKAQVQAEVDQIVGTRATQPTKSEPVPVVKETAPVMQEEVKAPPTFLDMKKEDSSKVYGFSNIKSNQ